MLSDHQATDGPWFSDVGAQFFLVAIALALVGGIACVTGVGAGFGHAGNCANDLAWIGVVVLVVAGVVDLAANALAVILLVRRRRFCWWWPWSALAAVLSVYMAWFAWNL